MSTDQNVLLTRPEVERRTGLSRSTIYRKNERWHLSGAVESL